jgi:hypothetical protein
LHRYAINRGEVVVTFDLSFKRIDLVLDFKYLNCRGIKINNYIQILLQRNGRISNRSAFVNRPTPTPMAPPQWHHPNGTAPRVPANWESFEPKHALQLPRGPQALRPQSWTRTLAHVRLRKGIQRGRSDGGVSTGALDHGIKFSDTAEIYAHGQSEIIIEEGLKKCGFERDESG